MKITRNDITKNIDQAKINIKLYIKFLEGNITYDQFIEQYVIGDDIREEYVKEWLEENRDFDHSNITGSGSLYTALIDIDNLTSGVEDDDDYMFAELYWETVLRQYHRIAWEKEVDNVR